MAAHCRSIAGIATLPGAPRTIALGAAIGAFLAFTPTFGVQMVLAGLLAALFRASAPAALAAVWITNPITAGPIYAASYGIGTKVYPHAGPVTALSLGGLIMGTVFALATYAFVLRLIEHRRRTFAVNAA